MDLVHFIRLVSKIFGKILNYLKGFTGLEDQENPVYS